ncbi:MAG: 2-oxo acid dehydrogenase subunit [Armatimonadetes bacterium]|nr:2-oxo acid dehydrogenase subunit [Armatimonadota bacterium]
MPKTGDGMEEGTLLRWLKKPGDQIAYMEAFAEIQTDKATIEIQSTEKGQLTEILVQEGETVPIGTPIGVIGERSASTANSEPADAKAAETEAKPAETEAKPAETSTAPPEPQPAGGEQAAAPSNGQRVKASPLARKTASALGVDLSGVKGTGPGGRIIAADVSEAKRTGAPTAPAAASAGVALSPGVPAANLAGQRKPMSPMRKVIARRLLQSKQTVPHFYLTLDIDMRAASKLRAEFNAGAGEDRRISFNDMVVRACVLALEKFPAVRSQIDGDQLLTPDAINIGVAVALDEGLIVPVIKDAANKSISAIGRETRSLADRARKGGLGAEDYSGGTFTVSNLGMFDVTQFQAIINPPETAIVAVGAIRDTPIVDNGEIKPGKQMYLTISADHRVADGHVAAQFMQEVKRLLQSPLNLLG